MKNEKGVKEAIEPIVGDDKATVTASFAGWK